jgi:hypothetical protein
LAEARPPGSGRSLSMGWPAGSPRSDGAGRQAAAHRLDSTDQHPDACPSQ